MDDKAQGNKKEAAAHTNVREQWSLLMDDELSDEQIKDLLAKGDDMSTWQTYNLIGDVLRSSDLAVAQERLSQKEDFLISFKARLKEEPLIFAPKALASSKQPVLRHWPRWGGWLAASGFAVTIVIGIAYNIGGDTGQTSPQYIAENTPTQVQRGIVSAGVNVANAEDIKTPGTISPTISQGEFLRNSQLDAYIQAHQRFSHNPSLFVTTNYTK